MKKTLLMRILGWVAAVILSVIYGNILYVYLFPATLTDVTYNPSDLESVGRYLLLPLCLFPVIAILLCLIVVRICRRRGWDQTGRWRAGVLILFVAGLGYLLIDSAPLKNDYTSNDLVVNAKDADRSYAVLMELRRDQSNTPVSRLVITNAVYGTNLFYRPLTNEILYADQIEQAWKDIEVGRDYIARLDKFEAIVDFLPDTPITTNVLAPNFMPLRNSARVYCAYAELKAEQGDAEEGVRQLIQLHSVAKKSLPNATYFISKMIWASVAGMDIDYAYQIASMPNTSTNALQELRRSFIPFSQSDVSIRRQFIAEYLFRKTALLSGQYSPLDFITWASVYEDGKQINPSRPITRNIVTPFLFNGNSTVRELRKVHDLMISDAGKTPPTAESSNAIDEYAKQKVIKNLVGWCIVYQFTPSFTKAASNCWKTKVKSELLAIYLAQRLGEKMELIDAYTGKPYLIDEKTGIPFSSGPDGKAGSGDDIRLGQ